MQSVNSICVVYVKLYSWYDAFKYSLRLTHTHTHTHTSITDLFMSVLALVWQLMRAYTLSLLSKLASEDDGKPIVEKEIVAWVNDKVCITNCI